MIALSLIDSFCVPLLSYGIESLNIRQSDYNFLDAAYNTAFAKIFSTYDKYVIHCCQYFCHRLPFSLTIDIRRLKFFLSLSQLTLNESVLCLFETASKKEFNFLLAKHRLQGSDKFSAWIDNMNQSFFNSLHIL